MITGAWEQCPYQHPEGWGHCTLLDAAGPHRGTDGDLRHVCDPRTGTRSYAGRPGGKRMPGETRLLRRPGLVKAPVSKRDQARWARKEDGQPACPRVAPRSGATCHLIDNPAIHETGSHEGIGPDGTTYQWGTDREDWARWRLTVGELTVSAEVRPGTPMPLMEPEHYPRPPGWEDDPGNDYAFSLMPPRPRDDHTDQGRAYWAWETARERARTEIARYRRRVVGDPTMFMASSTQWLLWFRTEEDVDAR